MSGICILQVISLCAWVTNGYVGRHIDGIDWFHGGYCADHRNTEGRMSLEFIQEKVLILCQIHGMKERKRDDIQKRRE